MPTQLVQPSEISRRTARPAATMRWSVFLALGFRPFFLAAICAAVVLIGLWISAWMGHLSFEFAHYGMIYWHAHEMLYGFVAAAIAGFVLTASANWTGMQTVHGLPLLLLFAVWLSGRIAPFVPGVPATWVAVVDLAFWPLLLASYLPPILRAKNFRNLVFVPILGVLFVGSLLMHLQALQLAETAALGTRVGVYTIVVLMSLVAGRVVPFFTERAAPAANPRRYPLLERILPAVTVVAALAAVVGRPFGGLQIALFGITGSLHLLRLWGWFGVSVLRKPLLWILFVGYVWIPVGFGLLVLSALGVVTQSTAVHAFTAGGMGTLILGIVTRVTLGHTGRLLEPSRWTVAAYGLIVIAGVSRVTGAAANLDSFLIFSAAAWILAYSLVALVYVPMLLAPRTDGKAW